MRILLLALLLLPATALAEDLPALPASFTGSLPCEACDGVDWHLDLWEDGVYHLSRTWRGGSAPQRLDALGRWDRVQGGRIDLCGTEEGIQLSPEGPRALRLVQGGKGTLAGDGTLAPATLVLTLTGQSDGQSFTECTTGRTYPLAAPAQAGLLTIEATLHPQGVSADRVIEAAPGGTCAQPVPDAALVGTTWQATGLLGQAVGPGGGEAQDAALVGTTWQATALLGQAVGPGGGEAQVTLHEKDSHWSGTGGCNRMGGGYALGEGGALTFGPAMMTMMACEGPGMDQDQALAKAVGAARSYRISGQSLALLDEGGAVVAAFEAAPPNKPRPDKLMGGQDGLRGILPVQEVREQPMTEQTFTHNVQYAHHASDEKEDKGPISREDFVAALRGFPWPGQVAQANVLRRVSPTLSAVRATDDAAFYVSGVGKEDDLMYEVGYVYTAQEKSWFGLGPAVDVRRHASCGVLALEDATALARLFFDGQTSELAQRIDERRRRNNAARQAAT